ncbi:MAG: hypothetical protein LBU89_09935 [Fibromonadaceae bacterium]|jgi:hypothetical protein|nr:hypothetical protein [Fibromonadaceae bacterium]
MKKVIISLLAFACFAFSAINVAVINVDADHAAPGLQKELNEAELRYITQEIRRQAVNNLPPRPDYNIMTEQAIMAQGDAVLQECEEENCMVVFGEKVGADYIIKGTVSKFRNNFVLTINIYETKKGMLVASSDPIENSDIANFIPEIGRVTPALFKKLMDSNPELIARRQAEAPKVEYVYVNKPEKKKSYGNFSAGERFEAWAINLVLPGYGSSVIMNREGGVVTAQATLGGFAVASAIAGGITIAVANSYPEGSDSDLYIGAGEICLAVAAALYGISFLINTYSSITYDKPGSYMAGLTDNFHFAVLPSKNGNSLKPGLFYNVSF